MLPHIASRIYGVPLLIHPDKAQIIVSALQERLETGIDMDLGPEASRFIGTRSRNNGRDWRMTRADEGIALISVTGTMVNRGAWLDSRSGMTSYEGVAAQVRDASDDKDIKAIVLDIDTPGGEATGMFNLAAAIREAGRSKRVVAVVDDVAASAGYGIASAAHEIVVSPSSMVGSIGVVWLHLDRSGELAQKGIRPTLIYAGAHKVDANSFGPLTNDAAAGMQKLVMSFYDRFLETVDAGRGARLTAQRARETEARVFIGADAVAAGLADRMATLSQVVAELKQNARPSGRANQGELRMSEMNDKPSAGISQADHDKAVAAARDEGFKAGKAEGITEGKAVGAKETTDRFDAVMALDESKGREAQAVALFKAGLGAEQARAVLAASPKAGAAASLEERIKTEHTTVGAPGGGSSPAAEQASSGWGKAVANANKRFG